MRFQRRSTRRSLAAPLSPARRRLRAILRGVGLGTTALIGVTVATALVLLALLQHDGFARWAAERLANAVNPYPGGRIAIAGASGTWVTGLELRGVRLLIDGDTALAIDTVRAAYDPVGFATGAFAFREIHLAGPVVRLRQRPDSTWDLLRPFARDTAAMVSEDAGTTISIAALSLHRGALSARFYAPDRDSSLALEALELRARDFSLGRGPPTVRVDSLSLEAQPPSAPGPVLLRAAASLDDQRIDVRRAELHSPRSHVFAQGTLPRPGVAPDSAAVDFTLEAAPLAYEDFGPFVPGFDVAGEVHVDVEATGTAAKPAIRLRARFPGGGEVAVDGEGTSPRAAALAYRGSLRIRRLDPSHVTGRSADTGQVNADLSIDLAGARFDALDGLVRLTAREARLRGLDARDVAVSAPFERGRARLTLLGTVNALRIETRGSARPLDSVPSYDLAGSVGDVARFVPNILRDGDAPIGARFELAGSGLPVRAAVARARLTLVPSDTAGTAGLRRAVVTARLSHASLTGRAALAIGSGEVALPFTVTLADSIAYRVDGATIRQLDGARLLGVAVPSRVDADLALSGRGVAPRSLSADWSVELHGAWGGYDSVDASLTGSARDGAFRARASARLDSARVAMQAALVPFGATPTLTVEQLDVEHLNLARLGPDGLPTSELSGSLTLRAVGADLGRAMGRIGQPADSQPTAVGLVATIDLLAARVAGFDMGTANVALALVHDSLRFDGAFEGPDGSVRVTALALPFTRPIAYRVSEARFARLDLQPLIGPGFASDLNGRVTLAGRDLAPHRLTLDAALVLDSSTVRGVAFPSSRLMLRADAGRMAVRGSVTRPHGTASLEADAVLPENGDPHRLDVRIALDDTVTVDGREPLATSLSVAASLVRAAPRDSHAPLAVTVSSRGRAGEALLDSAHVAFETGRGTLAIDTLFVHSPFARVAAAGQLALGSDAAGSESNLRVTARLDDVGPLAPILGARFLGLDSARLDARVGGHGDSLAFDVTAAASAFAFDDARLGALAATAHGWIRERRALGSLDGTLHAERSRLGAVDIRLLQGEAGWDGAVWSARGSLVIDDQRQMTAAGRLDPAPAARRVFLESLVLVAGGEPWTLEQPVEARYGDTLAVRGLRLVSRDGSVTVDGALDGDPDAHLRAQLTSVPLDAFSDLLGFPVLGGQLDGAIDLTGSARAPRATGELVVELRARGNQAARVTSRFDWYGQRLGVDVRVADRAGGSLALVGTLPRAMPLGAPLGDGEHATSPGSIDLRLATTEGGLRLDVAEPFLDPRAATDLAGRLIADARIGGSLEAPVLSGEVLVRDGRVRVPTLGAVYDSIRGRAVLTRDRVRLEDVRIVSGRGTLEVTGSLAMGRRAARPLDLLVRLSGFSAVATSSYQATLTGEVRLHGERGAPVLEGSVMVRDAHVNLSTSQATSRVERVELTSADLRTLEERFGYGLSGVRSPLDGIYDALTLDLTVQLERNTWLRHPQNPQVVLELVGRVRVRKSPNGELLADGTIELLPGRSYVEQFGARFEVRSGEVVLAGPPEELHLNVKTRHEAGTRQTRRDGRTTEPAVVITMDVEGTPEEIRLTLASDPELTDIEIISYLATGRLPNWTPGGTQQQGSVAADIALRQVTRNVQGALGETLPLDVMEIRSDGVRGLTLVAGRYTSPQLYVGVKQPISFSTDEHSSTTATKTTEFEVEYEAYQWLLMNLQGGSSALRFFLKTRRAF